MELRDEISEAYERAKRTGKVTVSPFVKKYKQHGLTLPEDEILGAFGSAGSLDTEEIGSYGYTPEQRQAFTSLMHKGLLDRRTQNDETSVYKLTPKGKSLWNDRAKEEELGLQ